jgi:hypothetical protein
MWDGIGKMSLYLCSEEKDFVVMGSKLLSATMIKFCSGLGYFTYFMVYIQQGSFSFQMVNVCVLRESY